MFVKLIFETVSSNFCKVEKNTKSKQNFWLFHEKKIALKKIFIQYHTGGEVYLR